LQTDAAEHHNTLKYNPAEFNYMTNRHPYNGLFSMTTWLSRHQKG